MCKKLDDRDARSSEPSLIWDIHKDWSMKTVFPKPKCEISNMSQLPYFLSDFSAYFLHQYNVREIFILSFEVMN